MSKKEYQKMLEFLNYVKISYICFQIFLDSYPVIPRFCHPPFCLRYVYHWPYPWAWRKSLWYHILLFRIHIRESRFPCGVKGGHIDGAVGIGLIDRRALIESVKVYILGGNVNVLVHTFADNLLRGSVDQHPFESRRVGGADLIVDIIVIDVKHVNPVVGQNFYHIVCETVAAQTIVLRNVHVVHITVLDDGIPDVSLPDYGCPVRGDVQSVEIVILCRAVVINPAVHEAVWIDNRFRHGLLVFFVDSYLIQRGTDLFIIFFVVEVIAAQLHADDVTAVQTDDRFSFEVTSVDACHTNGVADASAIAGTIADLGIVEIFSGGVDGGDGAVVELLQVCLVRIHGIEREIVVGVCKIYFLFRLAKIPAVVQVTRRVSHSEIIVHGDAPAQKYNRKYGY